MPRLMYIALVMSSINSLLSRPNLHSCAITVVFHLTLSARVAHLIDTTWARSFLLLGFCTSLS